MNEDTGRQMAEAWLAGKGIHEVAADFGMSTVPASRLIRVAINERFGDTIAAGNLMSPKRRAYWKAHWDDIR